MESQREIESKIAALLTREGSLSAEAADEAAFHLTDWLDELRSLVALYEARSWEDDAEACNVILAFVAHAPHHLAAAHLILLGLPVGDVFALGAVHGTGEGRRLPGAPYPSDEDAPQL